MNSGLQIGEVSKRAGVSIDTLRYYEKVKLLPRPARSSGGFRLFALEHIDRVRFIKQAQDLGFTLEEIKGLLATGGAEECRKVRDLLQRKLTELDNRLKTMKSFRRVLARHLSECETELKQHGASACCPVVAGGKLTKPGNTRRR
jgi:DNA-binding transcriptional MerR regulator